MILILGILSIVVCGICGPIAWVMGNQAMATLNRYGDPLNQRNMVIAGRICGIIGTAFLGLGILYYIGLVVFGIVSSMGTHR